MLIDVVDGSVLEKGSSMRVTSALTEGSARALEDGSALAQRVGSVLDEREGEARSDDLIAVSSSPSSALVCPGNRSVLLEKNHLLCPPLPPLPFCVRGIPQRWRKDQR